MHLLTPAELARDGLVRVPGVALPAYDLAARPRLLSIPPVAQHDQVRVVRLERTK